MPGCRADTRTGLSGVPRIVVDGLRDPDDLWRPAKLVTAARPGCTISHHGPITVASAGRRSPADRSRVGRRVLLADIPPAPSAGRQERGSPGRVGVRTSIGRTFREEPGLTRRHQPVVRSSCRSRGPSRQNPSIPAPARSFPIGGCRADVVDALAAALPLPDLRDAGAARPTGARQTRDDLDAVPAHDDRRGPGRRLRSGRLWLPCLRYPCARQPCFRLPCFRLRCFRPRCFRLRCARRTRSGGASPSTGGHHAGGGGCGRRVRTTPPE
jgi:hypothetical protein